MKNYWLPILILVTGVLYIFFIPADPVPLKILFKLIPMWLMICYSILRLPPQRSRAHWLMICGLFFCMLGDGLLHWFVIGLSAFLIGHLFYMTAFFHRWNFSLIRFLTIIPIAIYAFFMGKKLITALISHHNDTLIIPVLIYIIVISLMAWSAIMTKNKWASIGSLLFVISDSILSWNMFVTTIPYSNILIMTTYYSAQFLIAHSIQTIVSNNSLTFSGGNVVGK
ncbi:lysoplasmalogenase [Heyndrickxia sporothermodurans]